SASLARVSVRNHAVRAPRRPWSGSVRALQADLAPRMERLPRLARVLRDGRLLRALGFLRVSQALRRAEMTSAPELARATAARSDVAPSRWLGQRRHPVQWAAPARQQRSDEPGTLLEWCLSPVERPGCSRD